MTKKRTAKQPEIDKETERKLRLKGWEKRRMREKLERWIEGCQLDMYVDKDQMWKDTIIIRGHSADCLPIAMISMVTGWELFVPADEMLGEEETALFKSMFNPPEEPEQE